MDYIFKLKRFFYKILGIYENREKIADQYSKKRENIYNNFFKDRNVLDVGCGRGEFLNLLSNNYNSRCIGIDISRNMIQSARQINPSHNYIVGSADFLPFIDDSIDVIHFTHVFHHLPIGIQRNVLNESKRVAKNVIIIDDTVNWDYGLKYSLANIFWKITDGGYIYRTENQWKKFFKNEIIINYNIGQQLMRQCIFVIKAKH